MAGLKSKKKKTQNKYWQGAPWEIMAKDIKDGVHNIVPSASRQ